MGNFDQSEIEALAELSALNFDDIMNEDNAENIEALIKEIIEYEDEYITQE